ncbi:MAG: DUF3794 domain-containing protein [Oscillospiraceae bacterium]|nr:DUF3794 domain-containing protein [Oscillospiraceae bacterium]
MELQLNSQNVGSVEIVYNSKLEQAVDSDITLPEYCPDMLRILKCSVEPFILSAQAAGERVTIEGSARTFVLYAAEDGSLHSFEQSYPFTRTADISGLSDLAVISVSVKTEYANGRAVSQRRLDVHGMLGLHLLVRRRREDELLTGAAGGGVQTLSSTVRLSSLEALNEVAFPLTEVIEVDLDAPPVDQIISRRAVVLPGDVKAIKNKLLLKGSLELRVIYRSREAQEPVRVLHTMPISQILEAPGVCEECENTLRLRVASLDVTPKSDVNGQLRLLEINARVAADVKGYTMLEVPVLTDAYSTQCGLALETRRLESKLLLESFRETFLAKGSFELGSAGIQSVQLVTGELMPARTESREDALEVSGQARFHIVYIDKEGQAAFAEKDLPYQFRRALPKGGGEVTADVAVELLSLQENIGGEELELRCELAVMGELFQNDKRMVVSGVSPAEEEIQPRRPALTIYFAANQEPLWEIARRYRTTMDAIKLENDITGDAAMEGQMLLIPTV